MNGIEMTSNSQQKEPNYKKQLDINSLNKINESLLLLSPTERINKIHEKFNDEFALTTSFGIQSSVLLHMFKKINKEENVKIIWVDTGYLPEETYKYVEELEKRLDIKITTVQSEISPARMEAIFGKLWETNLSEDMDLYNKIRKVEPLEKALNQLKISCWASGVRRQQTNHRKNMKILDLVRGRFSLRPILDWNQKDIYYYMEENSLPQHPLFEKGFSTVGDWHSSIPETSDTKGRATRFKGLKEECGLHID